MSLYRKAFDLGITHIDAEKAHDSTIKALRFIHDRPRLVEQVTKRRGRFGPELATRRFGVRFPAPFGLAAGFDKNARVFDALAAFGFGFVEVGTITAQPQPGNTRPRLFRLTEDEAVINRMGFNNIGAKATAKYLAQHRERSDSDTVLGINIGKSKICPAEEAATDYAASAALLAPFADYLVINVSSPNTPGLRDLQAVESLRPLVQATRDAAGDATGSRVPLFVKVAPDAADGDLLRIADLVGEEDCEGIVATNTTISRDGLSTAPAKVAAVGAGGLSGPPVAERSLEVLRLLRAHVNDDFTIISAGGISYPEQAFERLQLGANLVQGYTGLIYGGPSWPADMNHGLGLLIRGEERG